MRKAVTYLLEILLKSKRKYDTKIDVQNIKGLLIVYLILILTFNTGIFHAPVQVQLPLEIGLPVLLSGYLITRNINYRIGGLIIIGILYLIAVLIIFIFDRDNSFNYLSFTWILVTVFIGTLFLNTKQLIVLTVFENLFIAAIAWISPNINLVMYISWSFFNVFFCLVNISIRIVIDDNRKQLIFQKDNLEKEVANRTRQLEQSLEEKNVLIRELYHRSNNNMQLINSLLYIQFDSILTPEIENSLLKTYSRLDSMALVHNKLYSSGDLRFISLKSFIEDILEHLVTFLKVDKHNFIFDIDIEDHRIPLELSIPLGLIINELLINVFIHADTGRHAAELILTTKLQDDLNLYLKIRNTNSSVNPRADIDELQNTGLKLVKLLAADQLKSTVIYDMENNCFSVEIFIPLTNFKFDDRQHTHSDF